MRYEVNEDSVLGIDDEGKVLARIDFPLVEKGVVDINHTQVDGSLRGQGVAGELMSRAVDAIGSAGLRARTSCSYAECWFQKHPERKDLLA